MRLLRIVVLLLAVVQGVPFSSAAESESQTHSASEWTFGVARVNITPERPMLMSGYASRSTPATGKLTDLWAKCLVLENSAGKRCALITVDLVGIDDRSRMLIGRELRARYNLTAADFAICCSHTHTGPATSGSLDPMSFWATEEQRSEIENYTNALRGKIVDVVHRATTDLRPGILSWGSGVATFATNRRNNSEPAVPSHRFQGTLKGPFDHTVPVLAVHDENGSLRSVVFGYACHATVLSFYQWSGDYPGFAQMELERRFPECTALFWAGCGADQNPLPRRSVELARHYGRRLAVAVEDVLLTHEMQPVDGRLTTRYQEIPLAFESKPSAEQLAEDTQSKDKFVAARAKMLQKHLADEGRLPDSYPYPIGVWQLGGIDFVFLGGEVVIDYALRLKSELNGSKTWVAAYANDVMAYIPSERVLREGGYEGGGAMVYYGLQSAWDEGLEDQIVDAVRNLTE